MPDVAGQNVTQAERDPAPGRAQDQGATATRPPSTAQHRRWSGPTPPRGRPCTRGRPSTARHRRPGTARCRSPTSSAAFGGPAAKADAAAAGLPGQGAQTSSTCTQQNIVCNQSPKPRAAILPGKTVTIFTASRRTTHGARRAPALDQTTAVQPPGPGRVPVRDDHDAALDTVTQGDVISTSPGGRIASSRANAMVNLMVSSGPSTVIVPDVVGDTQGQADHDPAERQGLDSCRDLPVDARPDARTGSCRPRARTAGTSVNPGATVTITVASFSGCSGIVDHHQRTRRGLGPADQRAGSRCAAARHAVSGAPLPACRGSWPAAAGPPG